MTDESVAIIISEMKEGKVQFDTILALCVRVFASVYSSSLAVSLHFVPQVPSFEFLHFHAKLREAYSNEML